MKTIADIWASYRDQVLPHDAPQAQLVECKRAFYAGAAAIMTALWDAADEELSDEQGASYLEDRMQELQEFGATGGLS
jgi:hypothetical protein